MVRVQYQYFSNFVLLLTKASFWEESCPLGTFYIFPKMFNFLSSKLWSCSTISEPTEVYQV